MHTRPEDGSWPPPADPAPPGPPADLLTSPPAELAPPAVEDWTRASAPGVAASVPSPGIVPPRRRRASVRFVLVSLIGAASLLGQGEECRVDSRFVSPSATLATFWEAMRVGDAEEVWECFVEGRNDLPVPGQLWFLPPTDRITLAEFRSLPVTSGRILVSYEVRYLPRGVDEERSFRTGDELVRMRGHWRISRPLGQASMPEWEPTPRPVDI